MGTLLVGLVLFFAAHAIPMFPDARARIVKKTGLVMYQGLFALISLAGLIQVARGYGAADKIVLWASPEWAHHATFLLLLPVFPLLIAAYLPGKLRQYVPHPMLLAVKIWAVAHLITNGDLPSLLLFGGFLAYAVLDLISIKRRQAAKGIVARTGPIWNDVIAVLAGLAIHAGMIFWGHGALIGVTLVG